MDVHSSARNHGVQDDDIRHAIEHCGYTAQMDEGEDPPRALYLGPDRAGNLLEVVVIERDDGAEIVIHAMKMRKQFEIFVPKRDGSR